MVSEAKTSVSFCPFLCRFGDFCCTSPSGSVKVSYDSGIHGVPGDLGEYIGSDIVYTVSDTTLVQCFCAVSGSGIQTNWWRDNSLSQSQIDQLVSDGWIYIPDGSAWGLDSVPYLAKNSSYNCDGPAAAGGGQVLGLATTGNSTLLYTMLALGGLTLILAILSRRRNQRA
ncbi:MAG: Uncharacterized protein G01um101416_200 [Microgenomates group bacterium Gr01-1014_16]|nr:MAG: Uncharacterized protein G01um101416_200 [Microgenomates group bacterium Gr01-1014_16]